MLDYCEFGYGLYLFSQFDALTKTISGQTNQPLCSVTGPGLGPLIGYHSAVSGLNLGLVLVCQQDDFGLGSLLGRCQLAYVDNKSV